MYLNNNFEVNQFAQIVQEVNIVIKMKIFNLALLIATNNKSCKLKKFK